MVHYPHRWHSLYSINNAAAMKIPFNRPNAGKAELALIEESIANGHISGGGGFTRKAEKLLSQQLNADGAVMLTTSCTHALEMAAILLDLQPGDEIIFPSYTFVSTALAFTIHGATPVFADIRGDTLNLDESKLESLITPRTRAIVPVHYAGIACDMDKIMAIARQHRLVVIEDNAHGLYGKYKGQFLGTFGQMAVQSFHETKNITCGEGGALIINDSRFVKRAEIIRDKGTDRSRFYRGEVDKYTWVDYGSSYCLSDILAAFLYGQLKRSERIQASRCIVWQRYYNALKKIAEANNVRLPIVPSQCEQPYHMFYMIMPDLNHRKAFIDYLRSENIEAVFHYNSLHRSAMGERLGKKRFDCPVADRISDTLVRLPFFQMEPAIQDRIISTIKSFGPWQNAPR
jgi:dTDP-4-amino-4,6-dideoxygalactose transaminase